MNRERKPIIGVTGPDEGGYWMWLFTKWCVFRAGGTARRITAVSPVANSENIDGLILGGGSHVDPLNYGQETRLADAQVSLKTVLKKRGLWRYLIDVSIAAGRWIFALSNTPTYDPERDTLELQLLLAAIEEKKPVLGICRGMQLMNVAAKGSLHQDLSQFYVEQVAGQSVFAHKPVTVEPNTVLARVLQEDRVTVNSLHSQGVSDIGEQLMINARDNHGVIQGLENPSLPFFVGVQWHPEFLLHHRAQNRLFEALVQASQG